jgi:hypothetical protein
MPTMATFASILDPFIAVLPFACCRRIVCVFTCSYLTHSLGPRIEYAPRPAGIRE